MTTARLIGVLARVICAHVLACSAYPKGARDRQIWQRPASWPDVGLLTIASALDRHLGAMPLLVMHAHSGTSPAFVVCAQAVVRYGMWIT